MACALLVSISGYHHINSIEIQHGLFCSNINNISWKFAENHSHDKVDFSLCQYTVGAILKASWDIFQNRCRETITLILGTSMYVQYSETNILDKYIQRTGLIPCIWLFIYPYLEPLSNYLPLLPIWWKFSNSN